ncbi:lysophospholipid acyltransferase family protein [Flexibacterium corallicola]|uniref:lysophospholipid acyltransferase family protein n=1 Tax=Flexibacterium corallicola TaxID=3037259 RepID=UPI00286F6A05|nr:lysophospholipid acyltransferase family protein [Pseudovibrio sp. M1P-2-3]
MDLPLWLLTDIRMRLEVLAIICLINFLSLLPIEVASTIPGKLLRWFAPFSNRHKRARKNLIAIFPYCTVQQREALLRHMWENMGRVFGELPFLSQIASNPNRMHIENIEGIRVILKKNKGVIAVSGHFGNWELGAAPSFLLDQPQLSIYREINNPYVDKYLKRYREKICPTGLLPKGNHSLKTAVRALRQGYVLGMLIDQRHSQGLTVPFLDRPAETTHAPALLAYRRNTPIVAAVIIRTQGVRFKMMWREISYKKTGNSKEDIKAITVAINRQLECWVLQYPEQWLWSHSRWKRRKQREKKQATAAVPTEA